LAPARFRLDSVVRALPSFSRSQSPIGSLSTDRIVGGTQSPGRGGLEISILAALLPGLYPQATWVAFILATRNSSSPTRSTDAIRPLAVGPAARLPATGSRQPHTDSSAGPRLGPTPDGPPRLHPAAAAPG